MERREVGFVVGFAGVVILGELMLKHLALSMAMATVAAIVILSMF